MKAEFQPYNKRTRDEMQTLWENSLITFDTSVLLSLYRVSPQLSSRFFEFVDRIKDRCFITHQVALEFHRNRYRALYDNQSKLSDFKRDLIKYQEEFENSRFYPYLADSTKKALKAELNAKSTQIDKRIKYSSQLDKNDLIYDKIIALFEDKIEKSFSVEELSSIKNEAKDRFKHKIPPGYSDADKLNGNEYGDFIVWSEILRKAGECSKSVILVSEDQKEDWIWIERRRNIGTRPELVLEMRDKTNQDFAISTFENFFLSVSELLKVKMARTEIKEEFQLESIIDNTASREASINRRLTELKSERVRIINKKNSLEEKPELTESEQKEIDDIDFRLSFIDAEIQSVHTRVEQK